MKTKIFLLAIIVSLSGVFAQQKDAMKLQTADESGFIEVDKTPELISRLNPEYPKLAKFAGIQGTVYLKLLIDEKGKVAKAKIERGVKDMLDESALKAAKKAKFSPAMLKDKPVKVWVVLPIAFKLRVDDKEPKIVSPGVQAPSNLKDPQIVSPGIKAPSNLDDSVKVETMPEVVEMAKPVYPEEAKKAGLEGKVYVKALIDNEGKVADAIILKSENPIFNQSAIDAVKQSKFTAAIKDGKSFPVWIVVPFAFKLQDKIEKK